MRVGTPETGSGQQGMGNATSPVRHGGGRRLVIAALAFTVSLLAYAVYLSRHHELSWYDLDVYNDAGRIVRSQPGSLYSWHLPHETDIKFTYTPFAGLVFALASELGVGVLHWLMTVASIAALPVIAWLTFRQLGWSSRSRLTGTLAVTALCLWLEPVIRALHLGQIEILLMLLIVWDLGQSDRRWWKGAGIGVAAAIKMVPLIFIPYLILCGKIRQAVVASATVAVTILIGFAVLPHASVKWWLTGYFLHAGNTGDVGSLVNQSLYAVIARAMGGATQATPVWLVVAVGVGVIGLAAAAALYRRGYPVEGWLTCAITGLLVSPISWDQHWVWVIPVLVVLVHRAVRAGGLARVGYLASIVAVAVVYGGWPQHWTWSSDFAIYYGMIGFNVGPHPQDEIYHLHGSQLIIWNIFAVAGLVMLAVAVAAAARAWRAHGATGGSQPASLPHQVNPTT
ncbi:MAG TPA: glycosyltransferase 87 family protein [Streptosporangiaceae bacterium]